MPQFAEKVVFKGVKSLKETDLAVLCRIDGKSVWIPKSQIDDDSEVWEGNQEGDLVISEWIAIEKRLV